MQVFQGITGATIGAFINIINNAGDDAEYNFNDFFGISAQLNIKDNDGLKSVNVPETVSIDGNILNLMQKCVKLNLRYKIVNYYIICFSFFKILDRISITNNDNLENVNLDGLEVYVFINNFFIRKTKKIDTNKNQV